MSQRVGRTSQPGDNDLTNCDRCGDRSKRCGEAKPARRFGCRVYVCSACARVCFEAEVESVDLSDAIAPYTPDVPPCHVLPGPQRLGENGWETIKETRNV